MATYPSTKEYMRTRCMRWRCGCLLQWPQPKSIHIQDNTLAVHGCGCPPETVINGLLFSFKSHFYDKRFRSWLFLTVSFNRTMDFSHQTFGF